MSGRLLVLLGEGLWAPSPIPLPPPASLCCTTLALSTGTSATTVTAFPVVIMTETCSVVARVAWGPRCIPTRMLMMVLVSWAGAPCQLGGKIYFERADDTLHSASQHSNNGHDCQYSGAQKQMAFSRTAGNHSCMKLQG